MKTSSSLPVWAVCLGCCLFASASGRAAPELDETGANLDVAVYDSSEVVEGRIVGWPLPDSKAVAEVELTAVHKGGLKSGQTISVFSFLPFNNFYVVDGADASRLLPQFKVEPLSPGVDRVIISGPGRLLEKGDRLALFLNPYSSGSSEKLPEDRIYYTLSGSRLLRDDQVVTPTQSSLPSWLVFVVPLSGDHSPPVPTVAEFRRSIVNSIPAMEELHKRFEGKPSIKDRTWLLELLRQHLPRKGEEPDHLASMALDRIKKIHDLALVNETVALFSSDFGPGPFFGEAYDSPAGRKYLLKRITDRKAPMNERVKAAYFLIDAGWPDDTRGQDRSPSKKDAGHQQKTRTPYFTRLVGYAWEFRNDAELCEAVLDSVRCLANDSTNGLGGYRDLPEVRLEVIPITEKFAADGKTDEIKYEAREIIKYLHA